MAAKRSKPNKFEGVQFVRFELNAEDRKALPKYMEKSRDTLSDLMNQVLGTGHKISFSFSDHNDSYIVSVTGKPEGCDNANKCYTSHGKSWEVALWVSMYKFFVVWKGEVWEDLADDEDFG